MLKGKKVIVAFSGGIDSTVVAVLAKKVAKDIICCTFFNNIYLKYEFKEARKIASDLDLKWEKIDINDIPQEFFAKNPKDRCYICKKIMMKHLTDFRNEIGFDLVIDGTNFDDLNEYRPGIKALDELNVVSPLAEAKITKKEVRQIARHFNLKDADRPSTTCLLTRIPYNEEITEKKLSMIEKAEKFIKNSLNIRVIRVRHHELSGNKSLARIELERTKIGMIFKNNKFEEIIEELRSLGYNFITIDLEGYRSGSMDEIK